MTVREGAYGTVSVRMFARPSEEPCNEKRREEDKAHEQVNAVFGNHPIEQVVELFYVKAWGVFHTTFSASIICTLTVLSASRQV